MNQVYSTDLTDDQWTLIELFFKAGRHGRRRTHCRRKIINGIFYISKGGILWEMLPKDFPPYKTVKHYFNSWNASELFERINALLVKAQRRQEQRRENPSLLIIDSQSVRGSSFIRSEVGINDHKKIKGRKRHLVADSCGNIVSCHVTAANVHDSKACEISIEKFSIIFGTRRFKKLLADSAYRGDLEELIPLRFGANLEIASMDKIKGFVVKPKRKVIERTIAWLNNCRRLVRDCEKTITSATAWVYIANIRLNLNRLAKP